MNSALYFDAFSLIEQFTRASRSQLSFANNYGYYPTIFLMKICLSLIPAIPYFIIFIYRTGFRVIFYYFVCFSPIQIEIKKIVLTYFLFITAAKLSTPYVS